MLIQKQNKTDNLILIIKKIRGRKKFQLIIVINKKKVEKVNGRQTSNSGATPFQKGDVLSEQFAIECKTKMSSSNSISIKKIG